MKGKPPPGVGFVFTVDLDIGPDGSLRGMRTGCASVGIRVDEPTMQRIGVKFQKVIESEVFREERIDVRHMRHMLPGKS